MLGRTLLVVFQQPILNHAQTLYDLSLQSLYLFMFLYFCFHFFSPSQIVSAPGGDDFYDIPVAYDQNSVCMKQFGGQYASANAG